MQIILRKKGQMKIQEMVFVLVAIMIFFAIVLIFYINVRLAGIRDSVADISSEEVQENLRKIAHYPEFSFPDCSGCVDLDKAIIMKGREEYSDFLNLDYLQIEIIYPEDGKGECSAANMERCSTITIVNKSEDFTTRSAFIPLCYYEGREKVRCKLG